VATVRRRVTRPSAPMSANVASLSSWELAVSDLELS
jgi:hypothetical protein